MEFEGIPKVQIFSETSKLVLKIGGYSGGEVRVFDEDRRCKSNRTTRLVADTWCVWDGLWSESRVRATGQRLETGRELLRTPIAVGLDFGLCRRVGVEFSTRGTSPQRCGC